MPVLNVFVDDEHTDQWKKYQEQIKDRDLVKGEITTVGALPNGMTSGRTSVYVMVELEDGRVAFAETSLALFQMANGVFVGRYGDESGGRGPGEPQLGIGFTPPESKDPN